MNGAGANGLDPPRRRAGPGPNTPARRGGASSTGRRPRRRWPRDRVVVTSTRCGLPLNEGCWLGLFTKANDPSTPGGDPAPYEGAAYRSAVGAVREAPARPGDGGDPVPSPASSLQTGSPCRRWPTRRTRRRSGGPSLRPSRPTAASCSTSTTSRTTRLDLLEVGLHRRDVGRRLQGRRHAAAHQRRARDRGCTADPVGRTAVLERRAVLAHLRAEGPQKGARRQFPHLQRHLLQHDRMLEGRALPARQGRARGHRRGRRVDCSTPYTNEFMAFADHAGSRTSGGPGTRSAPEGGSARARR